jgi:2,4-dienoyl-CoA reductase-like NADH-dependent reductase (Old Yellow Enzyme family)
MSTDPTAQHRLARAYEAVEFAHGQAMPNRFMLAPLTNESSHADGALSEGEHRFMSMRALGGFGLTMTCASHVSATGQGFPGQLGCFDDRHLEGLSALAESINRTGSRSFIQLHHAGNRSPEELIGTTPVCPSDDPDTGARALSTEEVADVIEDFVAAAVRAERAGFSGVEIHGAHGYLLCQFLSPDLNRRGDDYGGSLENRSRIIFEIIAGIRERCSDDLTLAVRLSPERFGMRVDEVVEVFERLVATGDVDMIDMSLWDVRKLPVAAETDRQSVANGDDSIDEVDQPTPLIETFASIPRHGVALGVAGKIRSAADVAWVLEQGTEGVDIAIVGRSAILHHDFPQRCLRDPDFVPRTLPVSEEDLRAEGLSDPFVEYMRNWPRFVADPA